MTMLRLKQIVLDVRIQPRVAISEEIINRYCQDLIDGDEFPAIVVFHDIPKKKYYLADGWHRVKAAGKAKITDIQCDVRDGDVRAAIWFSLSANRTHGWNDNASDKRRAVMLCIEDNEWQKLTARKIAKGCKVSHFLVNTIYKEIAEAKAKKLQKVEADSTPKKKGKGKQKPTKETVSVFDDTPTVGVKEIWNQKPSHDGEEVRAPYQIPEGMELVEKHSHAETMQNYKETLDQNITLQKLVDSDEPLVEAAKEIHKLKATNKNLESRFHAIMNEKAEAIRHVKSRDAIIKKQNDQLKKLGAEEF